MGQKRNNVVLTVCVLILCLSAAVIAQIPMHSPDKNQFLLNEVVDISAAMPGLNGHGCARRGSNG